MGKKYTESKKKYNMEYMQRTFKRIALNVRKEYNEAVLSKIPELTGMSVTSFIKTAIKEKIERDGLDLPDIKA